MTVVEDIRRLDAEGVTGREIARILGVSRDSVVKYTQAGDFSPAPPSPAARPGARVLGGLEQVIEAWLVEDARRPRKQRHTAKRVFDRLVDEHGYAGWYSPVQRLVKRFKTAHRSRGDGFLELVWPPSAADYRQIGIVQPAKAFQVLHRYLIGESAEPGGLLIT